ncbi:GspE/PulE family protein [Mucilaginibacter lutimaris]|uniref:GspE/PulE family protein n=1 Tax=Mucilaginibacter lutimaris TaxID=931629 RepID=A0ABW2ZIV2_9SPHI
MQEITLSTDDLHKLRPETAWHYQVLPKEWSANEFELYCSESSDLEMLEEEMRVVLGANVRLYALPKPTVERLLSKYYQRAGNEKAPETSAKSGNYLRKLIAEARTLRSSDIHIEIYESKCRVRMRIDGLLVERQLIPQEDYSLLVNIIKVESNLDIAEKRLPQDGRMSFVTAESKFDIRVSVLPTLYGEKVVLRLLNNDAADITLERLGFSDRDLNNFLQGVKRPNGLLLISGPTGSGKTTTLYATLKLLNEERRNILTIEDPIEYTMNGINQTQLKESIGLTFGEALRTFLRQDPDVIMVGEIRDQDTANMAIRAAMTGHLVLSTIHTNSAWGTVNRLIDMGIPAFMLSGTLNTTVAQRLVRLLCPDCKKKVGYDPSVFPPHFRLPEEIETCYEPEGCGKCFFTGYKGRKAIYEVIPIDLELSGEIKKNNQQVNDLLDARGIGTLAGNAFSLFRDGATSAEEIYPLLFNF